jgi:hypothetical protein
MEYTTPTKVTLFDAGVLERRLRPEIFYAIQLLYRPV